MLPEVTPEALSAEIAPTPTAEPAAPTVTADHQALTGAPFDAMSFKSMDSDFEDLPPDPSQDLAPTAPPVVQPAVATPTVPVSPAVQSPAPAAPAVQPAAQPAAQPAVAAQPAAQPAQAPVEPAAAAAPAAQPAVQQSYEPFQQAVGMLQEHEQAFVEKIADQMYAIPQEEFDKALSGDSAPIRTLAARIHVNAVKSVMNTVAQHLPVYVHALMESRQKNQHFEDSFWQQNAHLDRNQHRDLVVQAATMFRRMNPTVTDPAVINRTVGTLVASMAGLPLTPSAPVAGAPVQPQVQTPGKVVRTVPSPGFSPAGVGAPAAASPNGQAPTNPWDVFTSIMQADQAGLLDDAR